MENLDVDGTDYPTEGDDGRGRHAQAFYTIPLHDFVQWDD